MSIGRRARQQLAELIDDHGCVALLDELLNVLEDRASTEVDQSAIATLDRAVGKISRMKTSFGGDEEGPEDDEEPEEEAEEDD